MMVFFMTTGLRSHSIKKDGTKTINFTEIEKSGLGSDINALAAQKKSGVGRCPAIFMFYEDLIQRLNLSKSVAVGLMN